MAALIALVLILAIFGGLGFAAHVLWYVLIIAVLLWLIGFFVGGVADGGGRRWYGRQRTAQRTWNSQRSNRGCQGLDAL